MLVHYCRQKNLNYPLPAHTHTHTHTHHKFIGSEGMNEVKGDAAAADCMKRLRQARIKSRAQPPKTTITLQFKGLGVFDEKSKVGMEHYWVSVTFLN